MLQPPHSSPGRSPTSYSSLRVVKSGLASTPVRARRKMLLLFAAAILPQYGLDVLVLGYASGVALAIRFAWALALVASALLWDDSSERRVRLHIAIQGVSATVAFTGLVIVTGGTEGLYFNIFPSLPLLLALVYPEDSIAAILSGALSMLLVVILLLAAGDPLSKAVVWASIVAVCLGFGLYGSSLFRQAQHARAEALLERTRREALEQLAILERRRAQSEKLATIGQLAASVVHEINNPVAFVRANLEFLRQEVLGHPHPSHQELAEAFEETCTGVERVGQIVSDLRGFSRMDMEELMECSLADVVNDALRLARLRLRHVSRLEVAVPVELPTVFAIRRRLAQVLINLLVNAGDALEEHGSAHSEVRITGSAEGSRVVLRVEDNGPGFPPEVLPRLFETFFTTKDPERGTGLGLALSRELVEQFGGSLVAENRAEGGACLRLELPASGKTATQAAQAA
jgi:signal transduction histidine kinase